MNIRLTNCRTTARMVTLNKKYENGVVVSRDAMVVNVLYEVRVDDIGQRNTIYLGVTGTPHADLTVTNFYEDMKDSVIITPTGILRKDSTDKNNVGKALKSIKVGSRVGVMVDSSKSLHLYVDGHYQGVAHKFVRQPCFAVFDLRENGIQVTALPTSRWV
ncbi:neuralized-like protein 4 [Pomacea canaliculata]|uniref:neuralized-like protein 4 n=1 Tax=Pomacea canaliculata TaxID=400727 RepID=UPI000D73F649|nr:neuralized-like protein 4 [Pomacea canaliculata]